MVARTETANSASWLFEPDVLARLGDRTRAILRARLIDELNGEPVRGPTHVQSGRADLYARVATDGMVGLVAQPSRQLPELATDPAPLTLDVHSSGYLPRRLAGTLGPIAGFPDDFAALDLGDVALHRPGVVIHGRVLHNLAPEPLPLAGASIAIDALWSQMPPPFWLPPALAEAPNAIALEPGIYLERSAGTLLRERTLVFALTTKTLLRPLTVGQTRLQLSDRDGLVVGQLLAIDIDDAERIEVIPIAAIEPTPDADLPTWITLAHPTARLHRDGVRCTEAAPQPPISVGTLDREALPLDPCVILAAAPAMADGAWIEVDDGVAPVEYQRIARFETTSDADGYFRLPPIARVALVRLLVQHVAVADGHPVVSVDGTSASTPLAVALE